MADLGLIPVSHQHAIIETDDGYVEIKFRCVKHQVDCVVSLKDQESDENHRIFTLLRQNEPDNVIIYVRLPARGLYALQLFGKRWGDNSSLPQISTYLIAATTTPDYVKPFPTIGNQVTGQRKANIQMGFKPKSHPESVVTLDDAAESAIVFGLSRRVSVRCTLHYCAEEQQQELTKYTFITKTNDEVTFSLRFIYTGSYLFNIYAAPIDREGSSLDPVFAYVINVPKGHPEFVPFPKISRAWLEHCCKFDESGPVNGHVVTGENKIFKLIAPNAQQIVVATEGNIHTKLEENDEIWSGEVNTGAPGKLAIYANYDSNSTNFSRLLECEVKSEKQLSEEKAKRIENERLLMTAGQRRHEIESKKKRELQLNFERICAELKKATLSRDADQLRKAIAKVEKNNYTKRLTDEYERAKELKLSLDRVASLRREVLSTDQQLMAVFRDHINLLPVIHITMRAVLLLLGTELRKTKDWEQCKAFSDAKKLSKKIRSFDINSINVERAKSAKNILDHIRIDDVLESSQGTATFYKWSNGMIEEILRNHKNKLD